VLILQSSNSPSPKSRSLKPLKLILGIGALAGILGLGSTLASNIGLNSGAPIEFGQGVAQTTSCDHEVTLAPISTFVNADGGGEFKFTGVALSGLDTTDQSGPSQGCAGKSFTIKVYNKLGVENATSYVIDVGASDFISTAGAFTNVVDFNSEATSATLSFGSTLIAATDVYRITIESSVPAYSVGSAGPGGGVVYYVSGAAFTSTGSECNTNCHYLEVAPSDWSVHNGENYYQYSEYAFSTQSSTPGNESGLTDESVYWRIGAGMGNTLLTAAENAASSLDNIASKVAQAYAGSDSSAGQWFVPSMNELNELCKYANTLPTGSLRTPCMGGVLRSGFSQAFYWSSSEWNIPTDNRADRFKMWINFGADENYSMEMYYRPYNIRPVRAF